MKDAERLKNKLDAYISRTVKIRRLSAAQPGGVGSGDGYSRSLRQNSKEIGKLADENRRMLDDILYPLLKSRKRTESSIAKVLGDFCEELLNPSLQIEIDLPLLYMVSGRLLKDALADKDDDEIILHTRVFVYACYFIALVQFVVHPSFGYKSFTML